LVKETLEEICTKLGIISQAEMEEYAMFALYEKGQCQVLIVEILYIASDHCGRIIELGACARYSIFIL